MVCLNADARIHVQRGGVIRLPDSQGATVHCLAGNAWITLERDDRDILLETGDSFTIDRQGLSVVCAIAGPAEISIDEPAAEGQPALSEAA
jgi:hypothetical protein